MFKHMSGKKTPRISGKAVLCFLFSLMACTLLTGASIKNKSHLEKMTMERLILNKGAIITDVITRLLYKTQALAALVIQNNGEIADFERVAATLMDDPAILNILMAPDGVVQKIYPLEGNAGALGLDFFGPGAGNREAVLAKELGKLVFGGPFNLRQGGLALVGRLPVWLNRPDTGRTFWGFVSVTLKYPDALRAAGLNALEKDGFAFELWRINPDDGRRQIIACSDYPYNKSARYIEESIRILNAEWFLRLSPVYEWYHYSENWVLICLGIFISLLVALVVQTNTGLRTVKNELENMVRTDALTGLLNRKGLFQVLEKLKAKRHPFRLWYIDLNDFKPINDTHGHAVGDMVLTEFSARFSSHLDRSHIFARVGGDEFILICTRVLGPDEGDNFWEGVHRDFEEPFSHARAENIQISFSIGMAEFPADGNDVDQVLSLADERMYEQKHMELSKQKRRRTDAFARKPDR